jgi:hypothetical protein
VSLPALPGGARGPAGVVQSCVDHSGWHEMASTDPAPFRMTRDEFASLVAHELRNPLNAMSGWVHLLAADEGLRSDAAQRALGGLRRAMDLQLRQIDTLERVLRLAGGTLEHAEPIELGEVLESCADALRPVAEAAGRAVEVVRDGATAWRTGDRAALLSALRALGAYGLRHGLPGAPLVLALDGDGDAPTIRLGIDEGDDGGLSIWHGFGAGSARLPLDQLLAKLVLEAHGARVSPSGEGRAGDALAMRFESAAADRSPGEVSPARPHA